MKVRRAPNWILAKCPSRSPFMSNTTMYPSMMQSWLIIMSLNMQNAFTALAKFTLDGSVSERR